MILITIEHLAAENQATVLGRAVIRPVGQNTGALGDYEIAISKRNQPEELWLTGRIDNFPRKKLGTWDLLCLLLGSALHQRLNQLIPTSPNDDQ